MLLTQKCPGQTVLLDPTSRSSSKCREGSPKTTRPETACGRCVRRRCAGTDRGPETPHQPRCLGSRQHDAASAFWSSHHRSGGRRNIFPLPRTHLIEVIIYLDATRGSHPSHLQVHLVRPLLVPKTTLRSVDRSPPDALSTVQPERRLPEFRTVATVLRSQPVSKLMKHHKLGIKVVSAQCDGNTPRPIVVGRPRRTRAIPEVPAKWRPGTTFGFDHLLHQVQELPQVGPHYLTKAEIEKASYPSTLATATASSLAPSQSWG